MTPWPLQLGVQVGDGGGGARQWCFPPLRAFGKSDPLTLRVLAQQANLGSRASYRHSGRGPLPTKRRETPPIKALTGEAPGTRSPTEPRHGDQPNILPLGLNISRLILKTQKFRTNLNTISQQISI
jgi:hypothetical protein